MKSTLLFLFVVLAQSGPAHADRYIVHNPQGKIDGILIKTITFGNDSYVVVEAPHFANLDRNFNKGAESVVEDLHVGIPAHELRHSDPPGQAWHPGAMKYDQLPPAFDGQNILVAILDTGVDYTHPNLKDHINTFTDGTHGYDFDGKTTDPMDQDGHGTHCSGIVAASPDAATGAEGVAQSVKILPVRIIGSDDSGFLSNAADGIKYAVDHGAKVLSNSWRVYKSWDTFSPTDANVALLRTAIQYASDHGVAIVVAAGNETIDMNTGLAADPEYPTGFQGIAHLVVVAASEQALNPADYTNFGDKFVQVAAPGTNIISTVPGGGFESMDGTSMATPLVAGSIARGLSANYPVDLAISKLVKSSDHLDAWSGKVMGGGIINLVNYLGK